MKYIVGLGNPGEQYEGTRHNIGRDAVFHLHTTGDFSDWGTSKHGQALYARGSVGEEPVELLLPETFMNRSGTTVRYVVQKHDATPEQFIVVYDDVDIPVGEFKISTGRGSGGHNGVQSIIEALGSKAFTRVRIGVARKSFWTGAPIRPTGRAMSTHVLGRFSGGEHKQLTALMPTIVEAITLICHEGAEAAMQRFN